MIRALQRMLDQAARIPATWTKREKVFCVGANKTGTTSIAALLESLGYRLAPQIEAERMIDDWSRRDFRRILKFCEKYDAFQDVPFSLDFTFQALDAHFSAAKFILTIRSSPEEWFQSYVRFTRKLLGNGSEKSRRDLSRIDYNYPGFFLQSLDLIYGENTTPFDPEVYMRSYEIHNEQVISYFSRKKDRLLVLNLADPDAKSLLAGFLNRNIRDIVIPHLNSSK